VANGLTLTLFLSAARAFIEQSAPGMVRWEALEHAGQPYVKITPSERGRGVAGPVKQIFYTASGTSLLITLSESVLKHALEREQAAEKVAEKTEKTDQEATPAVHPWLGTSMALQLDGKLLPLFSGWFDDEYQQQVRAKSWANLPILNEWHRLYPGEDPVALHERVWHETLVCPGGGKYVWNEAWQTMESTAYGHPGEPKAGPPVKTLDLFNFGFANFGLTFEKDGLRARLKLEGKDVR
jgi:hypothetical protein